MKSCSLAVLATTVLSGAMLAQAPEWPGFRGPGRDGVAHGAKPPLKWSATENVAWKVELPGAGSSTPIIIGARVYVTCYSGYGADFDEPGEPKDLKHHIVCVERETGEIVWDRVIGGGYEKEARRVVLNEHGFASPTPITDGETIYTYFGKVGVVACNLDGEVLWRSGLGTIEWVDGKDPLGEARPKQPNGQPISLRWGAAASPLLFENLVIVNASEESDSIRALDRETGELVWKKESPFLEGCSISPMLAGAPGSEVLVMALAGAVWGLDPKSGDELWSVATDTSTGMVPTPVADAEVVYTFGGKGESHALRFAAATQGEDADARVVWKGKNLGIPSPLLHDGHLFLVDSRGMGQCLKAADGEVVFNGRLPGRTGGIYSSPVLADGRLYVVSKERGTFVYAADGKFELLAHNEIEGDETKFNASPALAGDQLFLRSQKFLYCMSGS